jgi:phage repressor protein C with HTH and peptisase S24 domain
MPHDKCTNRALSSTFIAGVRSLLIVKTLAERFAEARSLTGLNPSAFAREIGTSRAAVYFIEDGTTQTLKHETATRAANRCGVNVEWLATGKGPMRPAAEQSGAISDPGGALELRDEWAPAIKKNNREIQIPFLDSRASMGDGVPLVDHVNVVEMVAANLPELRSRVSLTAPGNLRLLTGYGDSMSPTFNDGDVLLIDVGVTDLKLDAVYVLERQDQLYVKRIQRRPTGALRMISDNPVYPPEDIDPEADGFAVLARVLCVWNFRKL